MSERLTDLANYIRANRNTPFKWGKFDCCLFAANALEITTGKDYAADFRGRYTTQIGAARALKKYGAGTIEATLTNKLGKPQTGLNLSRGDICLVENEGNPAAAVFFQGVAWAASKNGLTPIPQNKIIKFWSVNTCHQ